MKFIAKLGEKFIYENVPKLHEEQSRQTSVNSMNKFSIVASSDEFPFNLHLYNVYKNKDETPGTIMLGISPKGIIVFELRSVTEISFVCIFLWSNVAKLNVDVSFSYLVIYG